jgi:hypothetical protein
MKREILHIPASDVLPPIGAVLELQGVPRHVKTDERTNQIAREAMTVFEKMAQPVGIVMEIDKDDFDAVFQGEGQNEDESPVKPIARNAERLALFAVTIGERVCAHITRLFRENEFPLGSMLDATASEGAEMTARLLEDHYRTRLTATGEFNHQHGTLRFSPGYCGWHVSGQKKLFSALDPGEIGITLNDSYLMQPLKSISGVAVAGRQSIFAFEDTFSFCRECADHTCRDRIRELSEQ